MNDVPLEAIALILLAILAVQIIILIVMLRRYGKRD